MPEEFRTDYARQRGQSWSQGEYNLLGANGTGVALLTNTNGTASTVLSVPLGRGQILVVDSISGGLSNNAAANAAAGSLIECFVDVQAIGITAFPAPLGALIDELLGTFTGFNLVGSTGTGFQVELVNEYPWAMVQRYFGTGPSAINFNIFHVINNNTAGTITYTNFAHLKYHIRFVQE